MNKLTKQASKSWLSSQFRAGLAREKVIGVDPKYLSSYRRQWVDRREVWLAKAAIYDKEHRA